MSFKENMQKCVERLKAAGHSIWMFLKDNRMVFFLVFVFLTVFLFISTIVLVFLTKPEGEIKVPNVVGKQFVEVYNGLSRKGLNPQVKFYDAFDLDNGIILEQYPESGSIVSRGSRLKLTVSRSKVLVDVPTLTGIELPFALNKIKNLHVNNKSISLGVGIISYIPSDKDADNIVLDQSPRPGEKITPDRKINLLVSAGKAAPDTTMPAVEKQSIDLCLDLLLAKGLVVTQEIVNVGELGESGIIVSQTPAAATAVTPGTEVKLKVQHYTPKEPLYTAYEKMEYTISADEKEGLYEAYVDDSQSKRLCYSKKMKPGQKMDFVFRRTGNAKLIIMCDKKKVKVIGIDAD